MLRFTREAVLPNRLEMFGRRRTRVVVWDAPRLVYLRVPKSGNTSICNALPNGERRKVDIRRLPRMLPGYRSFTFIRNPWARLVSTHAQKIQAEPVNDHFFQDGVHRGFVRLGLPMYCGMPFEAFAEVACGWNDEKTEKHLKSQSWFVVRDGVLIPDFVGRVESMCEDWKKLGPLPPLPHLNRTLHEHYASFYDTRLRNLVGDRYRADVEGFDYDFME